MAKYPIVRLKPREGRRAQAGAPWVFSNEIIMETVKALEPGALVRLADAGGALIGAGYFNPQSLIAVRLLAAPEIEIDTTFFIERFTRALALRQRLYDKPYYRLVHAEGDFLPGLVIDRFDDALSVQITTAGMEHLTDSIIAALDSVLAPKLIVLRNDSPLRALEGLGTETRVVRGGDMRLVLEENGARYVADLMGGQKSGWYYDQRDNRAFMAGLARTARVLDAYCYSGGFAVLAGIRGATHVTGLDSSEGALTLAQEAAEANGIRAEFIKADIFTELQRLAAAEERFDVVICDPPPFARAKKDVEPAAKAYRKLARLAANLVAPRGFLLLASCSHNMERERFARECAGGLARAGRKGALIRDAGAGPDHPVHPHLPESAYLKALVYALD